MGPIALALHIIFGGIFSHRLKLEIYFTTRKSDDFFQEQDQANDGRFRNISAGFHISFCCVHLARKKIKIPFKILTIPS